MFCVFPRPALHRLMHPEHCSHGVSCHTAGTRRRKNCQEMGRLDQSEPRQTDVVPDVEEVGLVTQLAFSIPLLRTLVQAVAESEGEWHYLNVSVRSGAWVGVARRSFEDQLAVSTNHGAKTTQPYPTPLHDVLVNHGFGFVAEHGGYLRLVGFESDEAFTDVARLIVGTLCHVWGAAMTDHSRVDLQLSMPPATEVVN